MIVFGFQNLEQLYKLVLVVSRESWKSIETEVVR